MNTFTTKEGFRVSDFQDKVGEVLAITHQSLPTEYFLRTEVGVLMPFSNTSPELSIQVQENTTVEILLMNVRSYKVYSRFEILKLLGRIKSLLMPGKDAESLQVVPVMEMVQALNCARSFLGEMHPSTLVDFLRNIKE